MATQRILHSTNSNSEVFGPHIPILFVCWIKWTHKDLHMGPAFFQLTTYPTHTDSSPFIFVQPMLVHASSFAWKDFSLTLLPGKTQSSFKNLLTDHLR